MKRRIIIGIIFIFLFLIFAPGLIASTNIAGQINFGWYDKYISGTTGKTTYDNSVYNQIIFISHTPSGLFAEFWNSYSHRGGYNSDKGDEYLFSSGWEKKLQLFKLRLECSYDNLQDFTNPLKDFYIVSARIDYTALKKITPFSIVKQYWPARPEIMDGGFKYVLGCKYTINLPNFLCKQNLGFNGYIVGHNGTFGNDPTLISRIVFSVSSTFTLKNGLKINPIINFQDGKLIEDRVWAGISLSFPFNF